MRRTRRCGSPAKRAASRTSGTTSLSRADKTRSVLRSPFDVLARIIPGHPAETRVSLQGRAVSCVETDGMPRYTLFPREIFRRDEEDRRRRCRGHRRGGLTKYPAEKIRGTAGVVRKLCGLGSLTEPRRTENFAGTLFRRHECCNRRDKGHEARRRHKGSGVSEAWKRRFHAEICTRDPRRSRAGAVHGRLRPV